MFAVVDILGQQFKVFEKTDFFVHRLDQKEGSTVNFDKIYLFYDGKKTFVGSPLVNNITGTLTSLCSFFKCSHIIFI